jgi:hypothetical protein
MITADQTRTAGSPDVQSPSGSEERSALHETIKGGDHCYLHAKDPVDKPLRSSSYTFREMSH